MIKTFEKTLSVQIDDTVLRCIIERMLDDVYTDNLIDYINDSLNDESREAFGIIIEEDGFVKDEIVDYVENAILEKFEIERSTT
jgi:hypothetical protein